MTVQFINEGDWGIETAVFQTPLRRLKRSLPRTHGLLNVIFVSDSYIRSLNKAYRNKDTATDVLSFSYREDEDFEVTRLLGEVYISVPTAMHQAADLGHELDHELRRLFIHGILHVFGYDHETDEEHKEMSALEEAVIAGESSSK
jgi:probable rRNA maturation factor